MRVEGALPGDLAPARVGRGKDDLADVRKVDLVSEPEQHAQPIETHAGLELAAERADNVRQVRGVHAVGLGPEGQQDLLLAIRAAEIRLEVIVPGAHVLQGVYAVEVLGTGKNRY